MKIIELTEEIKLKSSADSPAKKFVDKIRSTYYVNPLDSSMVIIYSVPGAFSQVELTPSPSKPNTVRINFMQAHPLRKGAGAKGMEKLQRLASEAGISLEGTIWEKGPVKAAALKNFYKKMGFTVKGLDISWNPEPKALTTDDIHALADSKGIKWDNDPDFLASTKKLTGKEHLDDLDQSELKKVQQHLMSVTEEQLGPVTYSEIYRALKKAGYKEIGSGEDATVWKKDDGKVAKIVMSGRPNHPESLLSAIELYRLAKKYPRLTTLPNYVKIDGEEIFMFKIDGKPLVQLNMEQLSPLTDFEQDLIVDLNDAIIDRIYDWEDAKSNVYDVYKDDPAKLDAVEKTFNDPKWKLLFDTLVLLYQYGNRKGFGFDMHGGNVMKRPGTGDLVVIDPWVSYG